MDSSQDRDSLGAGAHGSHRRDLPAGGHRRRPAGVLPTAPAAAWSSATARWWARSSSASRSRASATSGAGPRRPGRRTTAARRPARTSGPINPALHERVDASVSALRAAHGDAAPIPVDLATASSQRPRSAHLSGGAAYQVARVAAARGLAEDAVRRLVDEHTEGRQLGFLGEPRVNVLLLNLALDDLAGSPDRGTAEHRYRWRGRLASVQNQRQGETMFCPDMKSVARSVFVLGVAWWAAPVQRRQSARPGRGTARGSGDNRNLAGKARDRHLRRGEPGLRHRRQRQPDPLRPRLRQPGRAVHAASGRGVVRACVVARLTVRLQRRHRRRRRRREDPIRSDSATPATPSTSRRPTSPTRWATVLWCSRPASSSPCTAPNTSGAP